MKSYYLVLRPRIPNIFFQLILNEKNPMRPQYLNMPENNQKPKKRTKNQLRSFLCNFTGDQTFASIFQIWICIFKILMYILIQRDKKYQNICYVCFPNRNINSFLFRRKIMRENSKYVLNHFTPMFHFYNHRNSGGTEMEHWREIY